MSSQNSHSKTKECDQNSSWLQKWTYAKTSNDIRTILLIHLNVTIYALSFWTQQPVLPFITQNLGANPKQFGYFQTFVSIFALIGGPLIGQFTDKSGVKKALILCQIGSAVSYFTLGTSSNLQMLFISQISTLLQQVMQTAQACIAHLTTDENREQAFGRLSLAYGVGMIVGSSVGGIIVQHMSIRFNSFLACFSTLFVVVLDIIYLPNIKVKKSNKNNGKVGETDATETLMDSLHTIYRLATHPKLFGVLLFLFFGSFGMVIFRSMFMLIFKDIFNFGPKDIGFLISYGALVSAFCNTCLISWIRSYFSNRTIVECSIIIVSLNLALFGYACSIADDGNENNGYFKSLVDFSKMYKVCIFFFGQTIAFSLLYVMVSGYISKMVEKTEIATAIALNHALRSLARVISPIFGGILVSQFGYQSIGYFGCLCGILSWFLFKLFIVE